MIDTASLERELSGLTLHDLALLRWRSTWLKRARPKQVIDFESSVFDTYFLHWGRGSGKTETLCNWICWELCNYPGMFGHLVAATHNDLRYVIMEGDSGVLANVPRALIKTYNKTDSIVEFFNGSILRGFSAEEPERLRGPQCCVLGVDELASWTRARDTWNNAKLGHRLPHPGNKRSYALIVSTPRPVELVREMFADPAILKSAGNMEENRANLSESFIKQMEKLKGTRLGRQELAGELLDAEELGVIKRSQWKSWAHDKPIPLLDIIIMSLDTALSEESVDVKRQRTDYTACTVWGGYRFKREDGESEPRILLLDAWQERLGFPDLVDRVKKERMKAYGNHTMRQTVVPLFGTGNIPFKAGRRPDMILIEDKNSGISLRQQLRRNGIPVVPYNPGRADKYLRLNLCAALFVAGYVYAPQSERFPSEFKSWAEPLIAQMCSYSGENSLEHEDLMDSATQALLWFDRQWLRNLPPKYATRDDVARSDPRTMRNPYAV